MKCKLRRAPHASVPSCQPNVTRRDADVGPARGEGAASNLLREPWITMALFTKDRDVIPAPGVPAGGVAREEVAMGEQRGIGQPANPGGIDAFLGKGTRVTG